MKILMLQDFFGEGCAYQENMLVKYYTLLGHEVTVIASTFESVFDYISDNYDASRPVKTVYVDRAKVIRLPYRINFLNKLRKHAGVYEIIKNEAPDLIYAHDIHLNIKEAVRYIKKFPHCTLIMDYHADYSNSAKNWVSLNILHKVVRKLFLYQYLRYIKKIFPVVPESARFLNEVYGVSWEKMDLLPLGCDSDTCTRVISGVSRYMIRNERAINNDDIVLITGGKFDDLKKTHLAIEAIQLIQRPDVHLFIFGKASKGNEIYEKMLREKASESQNIHFWGWVSAERSYELMAAADIAIFPASQSSLWQQAIGMHLPLIAGDSGGQDMSYLNQNNNLIKVDREDISAEGFAKIILSLINNKETLNKMKEGAAKTASEFLDYRIVVQQTLKQHIDDNGKLKLVNSVKNEP